VNQTLPISVSAYVTIIAKEIMAYKQQIKENELITKIRIIRSVKKDRIPIVQVASAFSCHRNTITNILSIFEKTVAEKDQQRLLEAHASLRQEELVAAYPALLNKSRKPHSHKKAATENQTREIIKLFKDEKLRVGVRRMRHLLKRRYLGHEISDTTGLLGLSFAQLRGIYKRQELKTEKTRSCTGEVRHLYDYQALGCFERLHYDVKYVLDQHALPEHIYRLLSGRGIPKYEWNILDARSRFRFLAYSYERPSEFGLRFLLFVIQYIRSRLVAFAPLMRIGFDNGMEFCAGSKRKEEEWNRLLSCIDAAVYSYEPRFDIRKNLIERSHLTDDEELYIPRGIYMGTKKAFLKEVTGYQHYWNFERGHSGIGMNNHTPFEILKKSGVVGAERLLQFPVLILDDVIDALRVCTKPIEFEYFAKTNPDRVQKSITCQKTKRDIEDKFSLPFDAQNLLTYYLP
jgi:hypothetical protein